MSDRDDLHALVHNAARMNDGGLLEGGHLDRIAHLAADAIIEAGWVRCLHKNRLDFRNDDGPWHRSCSDCKKRWVEA